MKQKGKRNVKFEKGALDERRVFVDVGPGAINVRALVT